MTLEPPHFRVDPVALREAFSDRTKLVVYNTPHNPTAHCASADELELIAELCQRYDAIAVADEVYETVTFRNATHRRLSQLPGMFNRTVTISSAGKIFNLTGWRIGCVATVGPNVKSPETAYLAFNVNE